VVNLNDRAVITDGDRTLIRNLTNTIMGSTSRICRLRKRVSITGYSHQKKGDDNYGNKHREHDVNDPSLAIGFIDSSKCHSSIVTTF